MANDSIRGRQVVLRLTNKSGGGLVEGDVVIIDSTTAASVTTTTTAGLNTDVIGVALEAIAGDAIGRIAITGYVPKINLSGAASLGDTVATHTVAKQAAPSAARGSGSFGEVLGTGTTPAAVLWGLPDPSGAGGMATDALWDAAGDLAYGTGANTGSRLAAGTGLQWLRMNSGATAPEWFTHTYISDNFNRADAGTVGAPQVGDPPIMYKTGGIGDWGITSNTLAPKSSQAESMVWWDVGRTRYRMTCTMTAKPTDGGILIFVIPGSANLMMIHPNTGTKYTLYKRVSLSYTLLATGSTANPTSGDTLDIRVSGTRIQLFVNGSGTADIDFTMTADLPMGPFIGFRENNATVARYDALVVTEY